MATGAIKKGKHYEKNIYDDGGGGMGVTFKRRGATR